MLSSAGKKTKSKPAAEKSVSGDNWRRANDHESEDADLPLNTLTMPSSDGKKTKSKSAAEKSVSGDNGRRANDELEDADDTTSTGTTNSEADGVDDDTSESDIISALNKRSAKLSSVSCISS